MEIKYVCSLGTLCHSSQILKINKNNNHIFTYYDNIDFLELHTFSISNGLNFTNNNDNDYLNNIINKTYNFNIEN